jgi:WXXGXW repeat (2 copies)
MNRYARAGLILAGAGLALSAAVLPVAAQGIGAPSARDRALFPNTVVVPPGDSVVTRPYAKIIAPGANPVPISPYSYPVYSAYRYVRPAVPRMLGPAGRWVQGYWAQQYVPQYYTYYAWIPGYFDDNGLWIEGHYETQVAQAGGLYQNVWVPGYWTP